MSLVHELAASVQCCFELFGTQSDGVLLSKHDQGVLNEISSILQPLLLRLQKQAVSVAESSELFAEDEALLGAVVHLRRALESLQSAVLRCRVSHWLLRVLTAEDVRRGLEGGISETADALQQLLDAAGGADASLHEVAGLQASLGDHRVTKHEALERLGTGLYKHMEQATEAEQVVAMLRFVIREAQNLMMRRKHSRASSSSGSRRDSDASDTSTAKIDQDAAATAAASTGAATAAGAGSASSMDTGSSSDGSSGGGSSSKANPISSSSGGGGGSKSKSGVKPGDVPQGETSLTDVQLLLGVQQMADQKQGTQQLVLHQILSILEELHEHKAHQLKHKHKCSNSAAAAAAGAASAAHLQSVPEGSDDTIAAVRAAAAAAAAAGAAGGAAGAAAAANGHLNANGYYNYPQFQQQQQQQYGGCNAAAMAGRGGHGGVSYGSAIAAMTAGLEELLWADPWDAAALTQLLELLLQASAEEEYVEVEEDSGSNGSSNGSSSDKNGKDSKDGKGGRGKWWGAAKAAFSGTRSGSKASSSGSGGSSSKAAAKAAASEATDALQRARRERVHHLVSSALDVLLRLTPLTPNCDSCFKSLARPDTSPVRSLALPLMAHCDTVKAVAGCIWSSWTDVQTKAARLLTILVRSEAAIQQGAGIAAAVGLQTPPSAVYASFCHGICSTGGAGGSAWHGLVTLLHSSGLGAATAGAEAIAAIGYSSRSHELCSSLAASQAARALLLLLAKHQEHLGGGGAAAAALHALSDEQVRPGMHDLVVRSYTEQVNGTALPLSEGCLAIMLSTDCLAACRAATLAASVTHGINWAAAVTSSGSSGSGSPGGSSLWGESFRAGQHLLQRSRSSSSSGAEEGSPTVAGAALLRQLVLHGCPRGGAEAVAAGAVKDPAPGAGGARSREDMCLEALVLVTQKLQSYDVARPGKEAQVQALIELLSALVTHMSEARVCGALPEMFGVVVPLLEALQRKDGGGDEGSSSVRHAARELHEQLMAMGG